MKHASGQKDEKMYRTRLLSIDAWRDGEGGWTWNNWYNVESDIFISDSAMRSTRKILALARDKGLCDSSKGRVYVDDDGYNLVICDRSTHEPLIAFCYGEFL